MHSDAPYSILHWVLIWLVLPSGFADGELGTHPELRTQRPAMPVGRQGWQLRARVKLSAQVVFSLLWLGFCIFSVTLKARALRNSWDCITCVCVAREAMTPPWSYCSQATPTCFNREIWSSKCVDAHLLHTHTTCMLVCYIDYRSYRSIDLYVVDLTYSHIVTLAHVEYTV